MCHYEYWWNNKLSFQNSINKNKIFLKRKWWTFKIVLLLVISIPYVLNMSSQKTGSALYVLRIVRVVLFDVILHIGDTTTDLLQIYYLYQGRYDRSISEYQTIKLHLNCLIYTIYTLVTSLISRWSN